MSTKERSEAALKTCIINVNISIAKILASILPGPQLILSIYAQIDAIKSFASCFAQIISFAASKRCLMRIDVLRLNFQDNWKDFKDRGVSISEIDAKMIINSLVGDLKAVAVDCQIF